MSARPATYTADRADRVQVGMLVHREVPLLSSAAPADGWVLVSGVAHSESGSVLTLGDAGDWFVAADRIVFQGA